MISGSLAALTLSYCPPPERRPERAKRGVNPSLPPQHPLPVQEPKEMIPADGKSWVKGWRSTWEHADP